MFSSQFKLSRDNSFPLTGYTCIYQQRSRKLNVFLWWNPTVQYGGYVEKHVTKPISESGEVPSDRSQVGITLSFQHVVNYEVLITVRIFFFFLFL